ncbi:GvpL/GvpF family gas vesicle protein [Streptomyces sp. ET3-23]|uniref:GvpL/GvpF family gas vesicle protein n=1 Tax=Streptomyces sp. ET3-23 TaxID=2885643 RepID=UPI001D101B9E|nr:GvpL/GvpF family gas vesicle protein [Streptomyces sp. ET3-23]MCC2275923.1 GvpL/GvpF family gas vesicle protein [Streptomyces sp. ET3-23]
MSTYVYCITRSGDAGPLPDNLTGVGDPPLPVRQLEQDGLTAVVSDCPGRLRPKRRDLLAHQRVLTEVGRKSAALPMRFGSIAEADDDVRDVLREHADSYRQKLQQLDGRVEYNIKAVHQQEAVLHHVLARNADLRARAEANRRAGGGTYEERLQFGELVAAAVRECETEDAEAVRRALEPAAEGVRVGPESTGWFVNLSFLVTQADAERLLTAVRRLTDELPHLELRVNGPLPPYSFTDA